MKKFTTQNLNQVITKIKGCAGIITCVAFVFFAPHKLLAQENKEVIEKYSTELNEIESYLNNIKTLTAKFIQQTSEGSVIDGKFYLSRPGKMRVEYLNQPPIVIVVNGSILSYFDVELDEISRLSTNSTPASLLTRQNISFNAKDVEVTNIKKSGNQIKISLMKKNKKEAGEFSLIFDTKPLKFVKMEVKNDLDQTINVTLSDIEFGKDIPDSMFILKKSNK
jgi:outer membrane lipoprotein-sorting protein